MPTSSSSPPRTTSPSRRRPRLPGAWTTTWSTARTRPASSRTRTTPPPKELWTRTVDPTDAPDKPYNFTIHFEKGIPVKVVTPEGEATESVELFKLLNKIGHDNGVGRVDIVENRFIGLKSRGCYDTPGLTIA